MSGQYWPNAGWPAHAQKEVFLSECVAVLASAQMSSEYYEARNSHFTDMKFSECEQNGWHLE